MCAQQAVSSAEQIRLREQGTTIRSANVDANGAALAEEKGSDDGMGDEIILQNQPRNPAFVIVGDTSVVFTDNAALTPNHTSDDTFFVANLGLSWTPVISRNWGAQFVAHSSIFRYDKTPSLDFQTFGLGAGISWLPQNWNGVELFAHYDFIEMLDRHSEQILQDHAFTLGARRRFAFGRAHGLEVGGVLMATLSEPDSSQRDLAGLYAVYHYQATQALDFEIGYRLSGYTYNETGRIDCNQILSAGAHYRLWKGGGINAFFSLADNSSEDSDFDYTAVNGGGGLSASFQF